MENKNTFKNTLMLSIFIGNEQKYIAMLKIAKEILDSNKKHFITIGDGILEINIDEIEKYKNSCLKKYFENNKELPIFFDSAGVIDIDIIQKNIKTFSFENCGKFTFDNNTFFHSIIINKEELENLFIFRKINKDQINKIDQIFQERKVDKIKIILNESLEICGYGTSNFEYDVINYLH